jgi:hypothetical protein
MAAKGREVAWPPDVDQAIGWLREFTIEES